MDENTQETAQTETAAKEQDSTAGNAQESFPKEYVDQLRSEAAKYRTAAKDSKALAEVLESERDSAKRELLAVNIAIQAGLSPALAGRLQGADEAALRADAEELKKLTGTTDIGQSSKPAAPQAKRDILMEQLQKVTNV